MSMLKTMQSRLAAVKAEAEIIWAEVEAKGDKATADERVKLQNVLKAGAELAEQVKQAEALVQPEVKTEAPATAAAPSAPQAKTLGQAFIDSKEFKGRNGGRELRVDFISIAEKQNGDTVTCRRDRLFYYFVAALSPSPQTIPLFDYRQNRRPAIGVSGRAVISAVELFAQLNRLPV